MGVAVPAVPRHVRIAEHPAGAGVFVPVRRAVDTGSEGQIVVVFGIHRAAIGERRVERMVEQIARIESKAAEQQDEAAGGGVSLQFMLPGQCGAFLEQSQQLGFVGYG
jgi:hypothetical protein